MGTKNTKILKLLISIVMLIQWTSAVASFNIFYMLIYIYIYTYIYIAHIYVYIYAVVG